MRRFIQGLGIVLAAAALAACGRKAEETAAAPEGGGMVQLVAEGRPVTGEVVALFPERGAVLVKHEEIPGYMRAMTMEFAASAPELATLAVGQRIRARLVEVDGLPTLTGIWPEAMVEDPGVVAAANAARQENIASGGMAYREVGEQAPQFALVDQDGRVLTAGDLRGKAVVVAFIFTRCQVAAMCPATTAKMVRLQDAVLAEGIPSTRLVFITLDPAYDTPAVLRLYGEQRGINFGVTSMLTGPMEGVADFLRQFGILVQPGDNVVRHTTGTLLVGPDGRILYREDGSGWTETGFLERLRALRTEGVLR